MDNDQDNKQLVAVLGMHRSGTSAVARGLLTMGVVLGDHLESPAEGINEKGYWEDIDIVTLNVEMMKAIGTEWHCLRPIDSFDVESLRSKNYFVRAVELLRRKMLLSPRFGFKDPRTGKLLRFWLELFDHHGYNAKFVLAIRNPISVVKSLTKRDGFAAEKGYLLWIGYVLNSILLLRGRSFVVVDYDRLMQNPDNELQRVAGYLGAPLNPKLSQSYKSDFLANEHRHTLYSPSDLALDHAAPPLVREIYAALLEIASDRISLTDPSFNAKLAQWGEEFDRNNCSLRLADTYYTRLAQSLEKLAVCDRQTAARDQAIDNRDKQIAELDQIIVFRERQITELDRTVANCAKQVAELHELVSEREGQIGAHIKVLADRDAHIAHLSAQTASLTGQIAALRASTSWRITRPIRYVGAFVSKTGASQQSESRVDINGNAPPSPAVLQSHGDADQVVQPLPEATVPFLPELARSPPVELNEDFNRPMAIEEAPSIDSLGSSSVARFPALSVVPYYVDPKEDERDSSIDAGPSIALHIHLYRPEQMRQFAARLCSARARLDLYISVPESRDPALLRSEILAALPHLGNVVVESVPSIGRDIAPLIVQFGERLAKYDIVGHFHGSESSASNGANPDRQPNSLDLLLGAPGSPGGRISHIVRLLRADAKVVYSERGIGIFNDPSGWGNDFSVAQDVLRAYSKLFIGDFAEIDYPESSMFWARGTCLLEYLSLPLTYDDFSSAPSSTGGTLATALVRLLLIFASQQEGLCYRIHAGDSIHDYRHYEPPRDYSLSIIHRDTKILAFYLPQFHAIPENDLWHGKGFTEWTKVRAANPLFDGHYQQHVPHSDIGYYLLDSPALLRRQAELMRRAGVYGQIFYHYSFGGKLILEGPANMLLQNADIQMPFCFCWANENWTRRWDGNESDILLEQSYSAEDARFNIRHLLPFLRDARYITVEDRPVIFVYRPGSIPDIQEYLRIWAEECAAAGVLRPYVVAVLTRGATDPRDFGMDAGAERVLQDWTAGAVPEMKGTLHSYRPINGSVLSYDEVVGFYTAQVAPKAFTFFRSLVPNWDNTARYGSDAYLLHGSTPQRFQQWLQSSVAYAKANLPEDRRFVLVNAWNEWAEGAHLEPDSRFGYGYLNSVGRALSDIAYSDELNPNHEIPEELKLHISFSQEVLSQLQADSDLKRRFSECISRSTVFEACLCSVSASAANVFHVLPCPVKDGDGQADILLEFRRISLFDPLVIEKMLQTACRCVGSIVIPNAYDGSGTLVEVTENGSVNSSAAHASPMIMMPRNSGCQEYKNVRMRADAHCFVTYPSTKPLGKRPKLTTILRFHKSGDLALLKDALYCLAAMRECVVVPWIAAQDLSDSQQAELKEALQDIAFSGDIRPEIKHHRTLDGLGDLRSKMLNEALLQVKTRYAAFLDFDDLLMCNAYAWLIDRLQTSGRAIAIGRVYATTYNVSNGLWLERKRIFGGKYTYEEFRQYNLAPIHSFALDLWRLDLDRVYYHEDQRYMEDYFLTLQLFTQANVDWASLEKDEYIGDYIHSVDRAHTLAFANDAQRRGLYARPDYVLCSERIKGIRRSDHY